MKITVEIDNLAFFSDRISKGVPLSEAEKAALSKELKEDPAKRGYGADAGENYALLCSEYESLNDGKSKTPKGYQDPRALDVILTMAKNAQGVPYSVVLDMLAESDDLQTKILGKTIKRVFSWEAINTEDQEVVAMFGALVQAGIVPQELVDYIRYDTPKSVKNQPRIYTILGVDKACSLEDVVGAMNG